jgi:hypothetical protein
MVRFIFPIFRDTPEISGGLVCQDSENILIDFGVVLLNSAEVAGGHSHFVALVARPPEGTQRAEARPRAPRVL